MFYVEFVLWQSVSDCGLNIEPFFMFLLSFDSTKKKFIEAIRMKKIEDTRCQDERKKMLALKVQSNVAGFAAAASASAQHCSSSSAANSFGLHNILGKTITLILML